MSKTIKLSLTIDDAQTLAGFIDGGRGSSGDMDFSLFCTRTLKKLDKSIKKHYATSPTTGVKKEKQTIYI